MTDQATPNQPAAQPQPARKSLLQELLETILLTAILFVVARFSLQNFKVDGVSMMPTLQNDELILVDKISYRFHNGLPSRGDIIVFKAPPQPGKDYIKRVIGLPGDTITIKPVHNLYSVFVNGKMLSEPYIAAPMHDDYLVGCVNPQPSTKGCTTRVPANDVFVMGDNRNESYDSRAWGPLPKGNIIGRALIAYWPLSHLSLLPSQYSYASVKK